MYGTVFRMRPKAGQEQAVVSLFDEWNRDYQPDFEGSLAGYLYKCQKHKGELIGTAVFSDEKTYRANAASPVQDRWYQKLRILLEADPDWEDGEVLGGQCGCCG